MPANFEYRPLGFEAFAAPLQQMQGYYDATKGAIEDLDFQIQNLPFSTDPEKAKELSDKMVAKRDQLTKELLKTKDYRTAASGIKNIQKSWINDPHRKALEFNYKNWVELNKSQRENIGKPGGLSQHQYEEWKARSIAEFEEKKGTAFTPDGFEGKYNTLGRNVRLADMTDKVRDLKLKVGNMTHAEKRDFLNRIPQAQGDIMNVTTIIEENDPQKIAQKVEEYMMSQPDVVEWAQELGEYKHWTITNASKEKPEIYKNVANSLIDDRINNITGRLTKINELAKEGKIDLKSKEYIEVIDKLKTDKEDLSKMKETEEYNSDIVKELIIQKEMNNVFDADAVGNVLGYKNVTHTRSFSKLPGEGDERETNLKNLLGGGFTTTDYATPNLSTLNKVKSKAAGELYNNIGAINNLAGNKMRSFVMGELDKNGKPTQSRQNLEKNPIKVAAKQRAVASIFTNTYDPKNPEQSLKNFHKEAWKQGFKPDWATSKAVFNSLQGDDGGNFNEMLRESEYTYQTAVDTENIMKLVQKKASDLPEFTKEINEFQSYTTDLTDAEYAKAKKMGIVGQGKNTVWGVPGKYSSNLYVKARVMGYLDLADAYKKGETFKGTSFYDQIGHKYQSNEILNPIVNNLIEKKVINVNDELMNYRYVGNKNVDESLRTFFNGVKDLEAFVPAHSNTWKGQQGFDEKGALSPKTEIDFSNKKNIKLVKFGNEALFEIPIKFYNKETGIMETKSIRVKPKKEFSGDLDRLLDYMDQSSLAEGDKATNDMVKVMQFDNRYRNYINNSVFDAIDIDYNDKTQTITGKKSDGNTIKYSGSVMTAIELDPTNAKGAKIEFIKADIGKTEPKIILRYNNGDFIMSPSDNSKIWYGDNIEEAKAFIARGGTID